MQKLTGIDFVSIHVSFQSFENVTDMSTVENWKFLPARTTTITPKTAAPIQATTTQITTTTTIAITTAFTTTPLSTSTRSL